MDRVGFSCIGRNLNEKLSCPWTIHYITVQINKLLQGLTDYRITHIFREGNYSANIMANKGAEGQGTSIISSYAGLPTKARGVLSLDWMGMPGIHSRAF